MAMLGILPLFVQKCVYELSYPDQKIRITNKPYKSYPSKFFLKCLYFVRFLCRDTGNKTLPTGKIIPQKQGITH